MTRIKPIKAWAIMDDDLVLAKLFCSDHRWHIYDRRDVARLNLKVYGYGREYGFRIARVEIKEIK